MKRPYLILTGLLAFVFVYLVLNDVIPRYSASISMYSGLKDRSASLVDPARLPIEKARLLAQRDSLSKVMLSNRSGYRQSEIGVIQCVTDIARRNYVPVESFSPGVERTRGQFTYFRFTLSLKAPFYRIGKLINDLENSPIPFDVKNVCMISNPIGEPVLKTTIQATALLYHGFKQEKH